MRYFLPMPIIVEADAPAAAELAEMIDEDIERFDKYFQGLGNDPLIRFEKAVLKTYLFHKLHGEPDAEKAAG